MDIKISKNGNFTELAVSGRLDASTSIDFEKVVVDLLDSGTEDILINLENLQYISSSGLRVFLVAAKKLSEKSKKLNLYGTKDFVKEVFNIAGFMPIFNFYD